MTPIEWTALRPHEVQRRYFYSKSRFNIVPAGRRSGKTEIAKRRLVIRALADKRYIDGRFFAAAPTRDQAKRIYWDHLKRLVPDYAIKRNYESDLIIKLVSGNEIYVIGMDKPERIEGQPWNAGILDEYANMKPRAWQENVRPALSDRGGYCDLIGVPEGRNHYYDLTNKALADTSSQWSVFTWKSADILPALEIESARSDLDELTFLQEYEASFINFQGQAYYPFSHIKHCHRLKYDDARPLILTFDFNVAPGTAAILQEQVLPNGLQGTGIIGEVHIPKNSNTPAVCRKLIQDWGRHKASVCCYGDATGGASGSAKVLGSDWDLIKQMLGAHFGERIIYNVPRANPSERSRINAVNSRLESTTHEIRLMVDPVRAPNVVKDFEGVRLLDGGSGEIDKKSTPQFTHLTDGIGYYIAKIFPIIRNEHSSQEFLL